MVVGQDKKTIAKQSSIIRELTPELSEKVWDSIQKKIYNGRVSKERVLHHLKQLKAQIGRDKRTWVGASATHIGIRNGMQSCMDMIDKKIAKINSK